MKSNYFNGRGFRSRYTSGAWMHRGSVQLPSQPTQSGITLIEMLVVLTIVGILAMIAAPYLGGFKNRVGLDSARDEAFQAMRQAQSQAQQSRRTQQVSFREENGSVEWAIHAAESLPTNNQWKSLGADIRIDPKETTLLQFQGIYRVQFSPRGNVNGQLGRFTLRSLSGDRLRRCIIVSTLLGALKKASEQSKPDETGRSCY